MTVKVHALEVAIAAWSDEETWETSSRQQAIERVSEGEHGLRASAPPRWVVAAGWLVAPMWLVAP